MSGKKDQSPREGSLRANTAARLEAIVQAAERAAAGVIDDAEAQARSYLSESRAKADREAAERTAALGAVTGDLIEEAKALRRQAERLQAVLEEARDRVAEATPAPAGEPERRGHLAAVVPFGKAGADVDAPDEVPEPAAAPPPADDDRAPTDGDRPPAPAGARLLATQMAVSGSSRKEIESRLRNGFGIEDTTAILDAILGPEA